MINQLQPAGANRWRLPKQGAMQVDALVFLNSFLRTQFTEGDAVRQLADAAALPGAFRHIVGMPDIHVGFGLPIGGVLATDAVNGVVSAGAVGMDINCGVRLLSTRIPARDLDKSVLRSLMQAIEKRIPTGVGKRSGHRELTREKVLDIMREGVPRLLKMGFGWENDLEAIEENGRLSGADPNVLSKGALGRCDQLATLGGGNHFIELGVVDEVHDLALAEAFGLAAGNLTVMIHTGSRGLGHQICTEYSRSMADAAPGYGINLPSRGLAAVPIGSREGQEYLAAMACAVNYAFSNRQLMAHDIRLAFGDVFGGDLITLGLDLVYDVAHNIAKFEDHFGRRVLVHRKGATRALAAGHPMNPPRYRGTGHPAIVPGSMGTASYVLAGTEETAESFFSINHGAGRVLSRSAARKSITEEEFKGSVGNVLYNTRNYRDIVDEAPLAYKNIDQVVETLAEIGMTRKVVRLRPLAVIKGEGDEA